jgi:hypothetical protein
MSFITYLAITGKQQLLVFWGSNLLELALPHKTDYQYSHNLFLEPHLENPQCTSCWGCPHSWDYISDLVGATLGLHHWLPILTVFSWNLTRSIWVHYSCRVALQSSLVLGVQTYQLSTNDMKRPLTWNIWVLYDCRVAVQFSLVLGVRIYQLSTNDMEHQTLSYYFEIKIKDNLSKTTTIGFNRENFKNIKVGIQHGTPMAITIMVSLTITMITSLMISNWFKPRMWTLMPTLHK